MATNRNPALARGDRARACFTRCSACCSHNTDSCYPFDSSATLRILWRNIRYTIPRTDIVVWSLWSGFRCSNAPSNSQLPGSEAEYTAALLGQSQVCPCSLIASDPIRSQMEAWIYGADADRGSRVAPGQPGWSPVVACTRLYYHWSKDGAGRPNNIRHK